MAGAADFLERIRLTELGNKNKFDRAFTSLSITATKDLATSKKTIQDITEKKFRSNKYGCFIMLAFGLLMSLAAVKGTFFEKDVFVWGVVFVYILAIILIGSAIQQYYFDNELNYTITVNITGISIDDKIFSWDNIYDTAILTDGSGKNSKVYLILGLNDFTTYQRCDLSHFSVTSRKLSRYIEYFKSSAKTKPPHNIIVAYS